MSKVNESRCIQTKKKYLCYHRNDGFINTLIQLNITINSSHTVNFQLLVFKNMSQHLTSLTGRGPHAIKDWYIGNVQAPCSSEQRNNSATNTSTPSSSAGQATRPAAPTSVSRGSHPYNRGRNFGGGPRRQSPYPFGSVGPMRGRRF